MTISTMLILLANGDGANTVLKTKLKLKGLAVKAAIFSCSDKRFETSRCRVKMDVDVHALLVGTNISPDYHSVLVDIFIKKQQAKNDPIYNYEWTKFVYQ